MTKQNLILIRNLLFRIFIVGLLFALLLFFGTTTFWDKWSSMVYTKVEVTPKELGALFVSSMLYTRFYLIFVILVPGIALHWLIKTKD